VPPDASGPVRAKAKTAAEQIQTENQRTKRQGDPAAGNAQSSGDPRGAAKADFLMDAEGGKNRALRSPEGSSPLAQGREQPACVSRSIRTSAPGSEAAGESEGGCASDVARRFVWPRQERGGKSERGPRPKREGPTGDPLGAGRASG